MERRVSECVCIYLLIKLYMLYNCYSHSILPALVLQRGIKGPMILVTKTYVCVFSLLNCT